MKSFVFKFTGKEIEYFDNLAKGLGIRKGVLISHPSKWLERKMKNNEPYELDFEDDSHKYTNPLLSHTVAIDDETKKLLKTEADRLGVTRYQLVRALIKKVPELIMNNEFYDDSVEELKYK